LRSLARAASGATTPDRLARRSGIAFFRSGFALTNRTRARRHPDIGLALTRRIERWPLLAAQTLPAAFVLACRLPAEARFRACGKLAERFLAAALTHLSALDKTAFAYIEPRRSLRRPCFRRIVTCAMLLPY